MVGGGRVLMAGGTAGVVSEVEVNTVWRLMKKLLSKAESLWWELKKIRLDRRVGVKLRETTEHC